MELKKGYKQTDEKLNYELDWDFIKSMAERMAQNKDKYEPYNWKLDIDPNELKQSITRHFIAVMNDELNDDGREFGHLESIALNCMMLIYQYKKY